MPRVPVLLQATARPGLGPVDDPSILAIRLLGTQLSWTTQGGTRELHTHIHHHRQVHQVDQCEAGLIHIGNKDSRVHRRNNTQVRSDQSDHHGLGLLLHQIRVLGLLPRQLHRRILCLRGSPKVQWPGGACQQLDPPGAQSQNIRPDRKVRLQMDPTTTQSSMGAVHAEKSGHWLLPLLYGLWF